MRVLICGNCVWDEAYPIFEVMQYHVDVIPEKKDLVFISGMAPGADMIAYHCAKALGVTCDEYPWNEEGFFKIRKQMGFHYEEKSRNQWMLDSGVDVCHAFAYDLTRMSGTQDMVNRCIHRGEIPVFWHDGTEKVRLIRDEIHSGTRIGELEVIPDLWALDVMDAIRTARAADGDF